MNYLEVYVAEVRYQKNEPLTYSSSEDLIRGSVVLVPYGNKTNLGVVISSSKVKPKFKTKEIASHLDGIVLPQKTLNLLEWMHSYYPGGGSITQLFLPSGIEANHRVNTKPKKYKIITDLHPLTKEQELAIDTIRKSKSASLVHGETGSGKSRLYLEATIDCLKNNKTALILTPEISLVPQLQKYFESYFGDKVATIHSGLTKSTRSKNWLKIQSSSTPMVVIGTRSALFSPVENLGLIVVDEMHEPAYKQDSSPRYYGLRVAGKLASLNSSKIIYGSATPPVSEYYIATNTNIPVIEMKKSALPTNKVKKSIVDMRDSKNLSSHSYLSTQLVDAIRLRLDGNQQSLLFLNRRGTARRILCTNCGWQALCPNCDTPLIYHGDKHIVRCHTCGHKNSPPYNCPDCNQNELSYKSLGTKALVETLQSIFPEARIKRFDTDNTEAEKLSKHYESVKSGEVDILVGTQMLGKGLDLPKLSLVGIINADTGLGMPDFSAAERSYQLLHQAIGRVGRGHVDGEVVVQTYNPESSLIKAATSKDWHSLYNQEIKEREQFLFPPFCYLLKITVSRKTSSSAESYARTLHKTASDLKLHVQINNPAPSFYERSYGKYNWQIIVKSKNRELLVDLVSKLPSGDWIFDLDPINLL